MECTAKAVTFHLLEVAIMCNFGSWGNNGGGCWWIIILILLLCCCGNGNSIGCGSNNMGCGCDNNCGCC